MDRSHAMGRMSRVPDVQLAVIMARTSNGLRILWAVDPFEPIGVRHIRTAESLNWLITKANATVTPASVSALSAEFTHRIPARWKSHFSAVLRDAVQSRLRELKIKNSEQPVILFCDSMNTSERVAELVAFSEKDNSDLLVVTTGKKRGPKELFNDSFAEALFYESRVPTLVFSSGLGSLKRVQNILFPTDFRFDSHPVFLQALRIASLLQGRLTLFHSTGGPQKTRAQSARIHAVAGRWEKEALRRGVPTESIIFDSQWESQLDLAQDILAYARLQDISLIAMQDKSSPLSTKLIGSNTRQVVRSANCPVLVLKRRKRRHRPAQRATRRQAA